MAQYHWYNKRKVQQAMTKIKLHSPRYATILPAVLVTIAVAGLGLKLLLGSHAATPSTATRESESGALGGTASVISDTNASGGSAVQFGSPTSSAPSLATQKLGFYPCSAPATTRDQVACFTSLATLLNRSPSSLHVTLMGDSSQNSSSTYGNNISSNGWGYFGVPAGGSGGYPQQWQNVTPHPDITVSLPLAFGAQSPTAATGTAEMQDVANGKYDASYTSMVNYAKSAGYNNITWRLGWEFDGTWMPWSSRNSPTTYVAAYKHVHDLVKALMPAATFDWCGNYSVPGTDYNSQWAAAYPGDSYVDIVGMDVYNGNNVGDTQSAFNTNIKPSLTFQENFAKSHNKTVSYPEWGFGAGTTQSPNHDTPAFVQAMYDWFNSLPTTGAGSLAYHDFFNQTITSDHTTDLDDNPNAKALFVQLYKE